MNRKNGILLLGSLSLACLSGYFAIKSKSLNEFELGLGFSVFFGIAFLTFIFFIWRSKQFRKRILKQLTESSIESGKKFHSEKNKFYVISILFLFLGLFLTYFLRFDIYFQIVAGGLAIIGCLIFFGVLFGLLGKEYLIFEFEGMRMGFRSFSYTIRWDNIQKVRLNENENTLVISLLNPEDITRYLFMKKGRNRFSRIKKIYSEMSQNLKANNAHLLLLPDKYGFDPMEFLKIINIFLKYPEKRLELKSKKRLNN